MVARSFSIIAGLALVSSAVSPALAEPLLLAPTTGWQLRAHDDKCRMTRDFGDGENALTLWIDKAGDGPNFNVTLVGLPVRSPFGIYVRVGFAPGVSVERNYTIAKSSKGRPVLSFFGVQPVSFLAESAADDVEPTGDQEEGVNLAQGNATTLADEVTLRNRFAAIDALELSGGVINPIALELDQMLPMADDLWKCAEELTNRLSADLVASGSKQVETVDEEIWAAKIQENYPPHLSLTEQQGSVAVRLTVNEQGSPTFCEVTGDSVLFNDAACVQLLRHARFSPARDGAGNAVASFWSTRITYRLSN